MPKGIYFWHGMVVLVMVGLRFRAFDVGSVGSCRMVGCGHGQRVVGGQFERRV
ncbi:hypothetical protein Micbo1qcDRAFT_157469, partial [Microdochium bolleyi]